MKFEEYAESVGYHDFTKGRFAKYEDENLFRVWCGWQAREEELASLRDENERLRAAILQHRHNMWRYGDVGHEYDEELYAALRGGEGA